MFISVFFIFFSFYIIKIQPSYFRILSQAASNEIEKKIIQKYLLPNVYMENMRHLEVIFYEFNPLIQAEIKLKKEKRISEQFVFALTLPSAGCCSIGFFHFHPNKP